jgi:hypothetical protein
VRTDNSYHSPLVFQSRLYFLTKLIVELQNCGARLTASNSSNLIWTAIEEYANNNGIINALNLSENSLTELLKSDRKNNVLHSHLIENLLNSIPMLLKEGIHGLIWIEKISQYIQNRFEHIYNKNSKNARSYQEIYANNIIYIYQQIDQVYGNTPALWYGKDIKFWIIVNLRRSQESFVERIISTTMNEESKDNAEYIYNKIDEIISKLLSIRKPLGDVKSYVKSKYKNNPFR